jgi:hypothetical protein
MTEHYYWWICPEQDGEEYFGPYDTKEEALKAGRKEYEAGFMLAEASSAELNDDIFEAGNVFTTAQDLNEENLNSEGDAGFDDATAEQCLILEQRLNKVWKEWRAEFKLGRATAFADTRSSVWIEPEEAE